MLFCRYTRDKGFQTKDKSSEATFERKVADFPSFAGASDIICSHLRLAATLCSIVIYETGVWKKRTSNCHVSPVSTLRVWRSRINSLNWTVNWARPVDPATVPKQFNSSGLLCAIRLLLGRKWYSLRIIKTYETKMARRCSLFNLSQKQTHLEGDRHRGSVL